MKKRVCTLLLAVVMMLSFSAQSLVAIAAGIATEIDATKVEIVGVSSTTFEKDPVVELTYDGNTLIQNVDFKVVNPSDRIGNVTADIEFIGDYSGTMEDAISYKITVGTIDVIYGRAISETKVKMSWTDIGSDEYHIYRYNGSKYVYHAKTTVPYYYDSGLKQFGAYYYKIKGVVYDKNGKGYSSNVVQKACVTKATIPTLKIAGSTTGGTKLSWDKNVRADGYKLYRSENGGEYKLLKKLTGTSYVDKTAKIGNYYTYKVAPYRDAANKWYYGEYSNICYADEIDILLNSVDLSKRHNEVKVYDAQGSTTKLEWTYKISAADKKILDQFAKNYTGMTRQERLRYTLEWINMNSDYGYDYNKVSSSWVTAIYKNQYGQCLQYNGALAAMMACMGYDVRMVKGYRCNATGSSRWQHFWLEVDIDGVTYIMETGCYSKYGAWSYFLTPYEYTSGYMKNNKVM